jgi:hypothetical protein
VLLLQRCPQFAQEMAYLRYKQPVHWPRDRPLVVAAKLIRQGLASSPVLVGMKLLWRVLKHSRMPEPILGPLFWNIVGSYQLRGLRDGIRQYGPIRLES